MRTEPIDRLITLLLPHTVDASFRAAKQKKKKERLAVKGRSGYLY